MSATAAGRGLRVLVLSADVGEGHTAAARAVSDGLRATGAATVIERDGLAAFGRVLGHVIRDGYRWQLRWAPWSYSAVYRVGSSVPPARMAGARVLAAAGQRRLRAIVRAERPDVVISTHPAITCVLGRMRLHHRLGVPVCATVTDLAEYSFWSHPGADLHLVMHEAAIARVERVAGAGSAALVRPFVAPRFVAGGDARTARTRLGLPAGRVVVVSGGGWGVGDLGGATEAALAWDDATVVVVAGRNDDARAKLEDRFAADRRVRVLGFTEQMDDLLRAADVLVHSTGGMTSFEALVCGCPVIAYGSRVGHIGVHNRAMAALGLMTLADSRAELGAALRAHLDDGAGRPSTPMWPAFDAASAVMDLRPRVRPLPRWRLAAGRAVVSLACVIALLAGLSTDDAYSLAARPLELRPISHVATTRPEIGLVVRAPSAAVPGLARALAARGARASFAVTVPLPAQTERALAALGDDALPELPGSGSVAWLHTRGQLRGAVPLHGDRRYLVPPKGLTLAQYLVGRTVDASPVAGAVTVDASRPVSARPSSGDVVVVTADGTTADTIAAVASLRDGLLSVPLSALLASPTSNRTAGADVSTIAPLRTTTSPTRIPAGPRGA